MPHDFMLTVLFYFVGTNAGVLTVFIVTTGEFLESRECGECVELQRGEHRIHSLYEHSGLFMNCMQVL